MGTDHGKIQRIGDASIELIEIVSDGASGWVRRERTVNLGGGGNRG
jgi:Tfp pilus assembly protein PilP